MSESYALVVGINDYTHLPPLNAAVDDATRIGELLSRNADKSRNYDVELLTSDQAVVDRSGLRERLTRLFASRHQRAIFYFSGHGHLTSSGGFLATQDAHVNDSGIHTDELLSLANSSPARSKTIILDCCHAGAAGIPDSLAHKASLLADNVTILAASRRSESAYETSDGGVFTSLCIDALEGGAANLAGDITAASLYGYVEQALNAWQQRPLMRSNVSFLCALRRVEPRIDPKTIRRLPSIFCSADATLALTPAFDPELDPRDEKAEAIMFDLRALLAVGLVKPVGAAHLYHAALHSEACRLTAAGQQQWQLADSGLL